MADGSMKDIAECLDLWNSRLLETQVRRLDGLQSATESFRNGMCEVAPDGKTVRPKINQVVIQANKITPRLISNT